MAEIVNLRRVRKAKALLRAGDIAAANRVAFGTSRADRERAAQRNDHAVKKLDQHRLDGPDQK